jgi:hypothetical protein
MNANNIARLFLPYALGTKKIKQRFLKKEKKEKKRKNTCATCPRHTLGSTAALASIPNIWGGYSTECDGHGICDHGKRSGGTQARRVHQVEGHVSDTDGHHALRSDPS